MYDNGGQRRCDHGREQIVYCPAHRRKTVDARPLFVLAVNLLYYDNGVIDDEPHRCGHGTQRHDVDCNPGQVAQQDAESNRDGNGKHDNHARPPRTEKQHHDGEGKEKLFVNSAQHAVYAAAHKSALVVVWFQFVAFGKLRAYLVSLGLNILCKREKVDAGLLNQVDQHGVVAVGIYLQELLLLLYLNIGNVAQAHNAPAVIAYDGVFQIVQVVDTCVCQRQVQAAVVGHIAIAKHEVCL